MLPPPASITRFTGFSRCRISAITEIGGLDDDGDFVLNDIFSFHRLGTGPDGKIEGEYRASGYLPSFIDEFITHGLVRDGGQFL